MVYGQNRSLLQQNLPGRIAGQLQWPLGCTSIVRYIKALLTSPCTISFKTMSLYSLSLLLFCSLFLFFLSFFFSCISSRRLHLNTTFMSSPPLPSPPRAFLIQFPPLSIPLLLVLSYPSFNSQFHAVPPLFVPLLSCFRPFPSLFFCFFLTLPFILSFILYLLLFSFPPFVLRPFSLQLIDCGETCLCSSSVLH